MDEVRSKCTEEMYSKIVLNTQHFEAKEKRWAVCEGEEKSDSFGDSEMFLRV